MGRTKKLRGNRTHGRGKKAGRGKGKRGGRGQAGLLKHKAKWVVKYDPEHFGQHGFKRPQGVPRRATALNVDELEGRMRAWEEAGHATTAKGVTRLDLGAAGVDKLLGRGKVKAKLEVTVPTATPKAVQKVEEAGGSVVQTSEGVETSDEDGP